jgi:hypothetical protein
MDNVTFIEFPDTNGNMHEHAVIDHGGGHFTTMPKEYYDALPVVVPPTFN